MNVQFLHKAVFAVKNINPTILTVVGIGGAVTAAVMGARATLKLQPKLEDLSLKLETVELMKEDINLEGERSYTDQALVGLKVRVIAAHSVDLAKLYGPAIILGTISIAAISGGHVLLLNRNTALAGALTATEKAFSSYRKAVVGEIGEEREREIRSGKTVEQISDTKAGTVVDVASVTDDRAPYARVFDETNRYWDRNSTYNKVFLTTQQEYANQRLQRHGYLLLNDVYYALGIEKTSAGAVVGWAVDQGDGYVDFGMWDFSGPHGAQREAFANGDERSIWLDFNVAGVVYDLIDKKKHS